MKPANKHATSGAAPLLGDEPVFGQVSPCTARLKQVWRQECQQHAFCMKILMTLLIIQLQPELYDPGWPGAGNHSRRAGVNRRRRQPEIRGVGEIEEFRTK